MLCRFFNFNTDLDVIKTTFFVQLYNENQRVQTSIFMVKCFNFNPRYIRLQKETLGLIFHFLLTLIHTSQWHLNKRLRQPGHRRSLARLHRLLLHDLQSLGHDGGGCAPLRKRRTCQRSLPSQNEFRYLISPFYSKHCH